MPDVLDDDKVTTPIDKMPEGFACDHPNCRDLPPFDSKQKLGSHRWSTHKLRAGQATGPAAKQGGSSSTSVPPKTTAAAKPLAQRLEGSFGLIAFGVTLIEPYDGACIRAGSHNLAVALDEVAENYPDIRKYVEMLCVDSPWFAVVMATMPILIPILAHHGLLPRIPGPYAGPPDPNPRPAKGKRSRRAATAGDSGEVVDVTPATNPLLDLLNGVMTGSAAAKPMGEGAPADAVPLVLEDARSDELAGVE